MGFWFSVLFLDASDISHWGLVILATLNDKSVVE